MQSVLLLLFLFLTWTGISHCYQDTEELVILRPLAKTFSYSADDSENDESFQDNEIVRKKRSPHNCEFPKSMDDSELFCKTWPSRRECNQTCMFGYTLKEGVKRTMRCEFSKGEWSPTRRFEKCKPFVDCTVSLGPGGAMKCHTNFMDHGPICEISCQHYEDKPAVEKAKYQCDINGKWKPKLPFCATPGTGITLVNPPSQVRRYRH
ncbi:uncharacterized protein LOC118185327 isoform X2 [Stegodyphus dumicola]|uniref:uncharacterized protein LOC118185327 isoform X2 n=1 Tax=Stegodyphus dumicola TaxID=202533 RepID=UPI0015B27445|nr:uncharacterized protein LOC118185327 isoform X2 [Stegodyphus dumicola]